MQQFRLDVSAPILEDLDERLARTRFARPTPGPIGAAGVSPRFLRRLVKHWRAEFDWRVVEARINAYPQFTTTVGAARMHLVHRRCADETAPTVVVLHGWPYSFVEMLPLVDALSDVNVVVPSLPGYAFSTIPEDYVATTPAMADTIHRLVTENLGVGGYFVYGEDVGAPASQWLAATHPEAVRGIHDTHAAFTSRQDVRTVEEHDFYRWFDAQWEGAKGYAGEGNVRHDTIAASLSDSPAGLAAWIVEKFRDWSDCDGDVERRFSLDALLTTITLYWVTDTFVSAYRPHQSGLAEPATPVIQVPATVAVQRHERRYPRTAPTTTCSASPACPEAVTSPRLKNRTSSPRTSDASSQRSAHRRALCRTVGVDSERSPQQRRRSTEGTRTHRPRSSPASMPGSPRTCASTQARPADRTRQH